MFKSTKNEFITRKNSLLEKQFVKKCLLFKTVCLVPSSNGKPISMSMSKSKTLPSSISLRGSRNHLV